MMAVEQRGGKREQRQEEEERGKEEGELMETCNVMNTAVHLAFLLNEVSAA